MSKVDKSSYSKVLVSQRLGVVPVEPSRNTAEAELTMVKKAILGAVLGNKDEAMRSEFEGMPGSPPRTRIRSRLGT